MTAFRLALSTDESPGTCGQVGGSPHLAEGTPWPECRLCGDELVAFLDIVLPESDLYPFSTASRLQVFTFRRHDDIAGPIYSDYAPFAAAS